MYKCLPTSEWDSYYKKASPVLACNLLKLLFKAVTFARQALSSQALR